MIREDWEAEFKKRLLKHYDEMKWLYYEVYNSDAQAFDYFCQMLHDYYQQRPETLKEWDEAREYVPNWYTGNDMLGMLMYTNCFGKNLKGVKKHLDYVKECGVNYLHLMPLLDTPEGRSDGGYAVSDFRKVRPDLGTMDDLYDLTTECHANGISVCLDFVMNHTSEDHEWAMRAKAGEKEYQDRYFFYDSWDIPNEFEKTVPQVFPQTAPGNFTYNEETGKVVMTTFYPYQWDLNYANPTVFNDMTADMLNLCNHGIDIVRLDATPYIWKELGTTCRNQPKVHTLVRIMHMAAEVVCPGTLLLGEVVMEPKEVVPYFGTIQKPECHMLYNVTTMASTWHTVATRDVRLLKHQLETVFALPKQYTFLNYLRCHDDIGWGLDYKFLEQFEIEEVAHKKYLNDYLTGKLEGSESKGELYNDDPRLGDARLVGMTASFTGLETAVAEKNKEKIDKAISYDLMLHAFLLTQSGIPVLYSGDEVGQFNDYEYHNDPLKVEDSRYLHRGDFNWRKAARRKDIRTVQGRIFWGIKKLTSLRKMYGVFENDADTWIVETYNDHVLGIGRYYEQEKLIALFNFSDKEETAWISENEDYINLVTGEPMEAKNVVMPPQSFVWLYHTFNPSNVRTTIAPAAVKEEEKKPAKAAAKKTETGKTAKKTTKKATTKTAAKASAKETKTAKTTKKTVKKTTKKTVKKAEE